MSKLVLIAAAGAGLYLGMRVASVRASDSTVTPDKITTTGGLFSPITGQLSAGLNAITGFVANEGRDPLENSVVGETLPVGACSCG